MEEVKLTPKELKEAIDFGKLIGHGFFGSVFTYKGKLIKLDKKLYRYLKKANPYDATRKVMEYYYYKVKEDFNDRDQIEELSKRQSNVRTRLPEGIISFKDVNSHVNGLSPGIVIPYFKGYENIKKISKDDYKRILITLRTIFDDIRNLADNEIAQEDITGGNFLSDPNILQKDDDAQLIDMSGEFVTVGSTFTTPIEMYKDFAKLIYQYYKASGLKEPYPINNEITEDKLAEIITEFEKQTRKR